MRVMRSMRAVRASAAWALFSLLGPGMAAPSMAPSAMLSPESALDLFQGFVWEGGSVDDQAFAEMASGLVRGKPANTPFPAVLDAIRATDRFRTVAGTLELGPTGLIARIRLEPWPPLKSWDWQGDFLPKKTRLKLFPDLRKGLQLGNLRLEEWRRLAEARLREEGHPEARLTVARDTSGAALTLKLDLGVARLIRDLAVNGNLGPYTLDDLRKASGIHVGRTLWTQALRRQAAGDLRRKFVKDKRLEGSAELSFASSGIVTFSVNPGPVVRIRSEGERLSQRALKELVPLARADRYGLELLDEGDRRIVLYFRDKGYLDVESTHVREVVLGGGTLPKEVLITYHIRLGERRYASQIYFEGNQELTDAQLRKAANLPRGSLVFNAPKATPELLGEVETRINNLYLSQGFSGVRLRRRIEVRKGEQVLVFNIREGARRTVRAIILELPAEGDAWDPWKFGKHLLRAFSDKPILLQPAFIQRRRYQSDRRELKGLVAVLEFLPSELGRPKRMMRLLTERPVPYLRADMAAVLTALNQDVASLGSLNPIVHMRFEEDDAGATIRIEIPKQELLKVRRLVVRGSDETRERAVARDTRDLAPGKPLNLESLGQAQANLGNLGAFKRVDATSMKDLAAPSDAKEPAGPWTDGDLILRLEERSHWVFSESFGYDKSTGYNFGYGVQRLNFQGMGRTLDFGLRAGDGTIKNPTLRRWFPTGNFSRSVDSFTIGYTDPWFSPGTLAGILPERAQYRIEASYIQEQQTAYLIRRRRALNSLEWRLDSTRLLRVGHRFERSDVRLVDLVDLNTPQYQNFPALVSLLKDPNFINIATKSPPRSIISAPYVQWIRDTRDSPYDPTTGSVTSLRLEFANQFLGTSSNSSFVKFDARQQWTWPMGYRASAGVVSLGVRLGAARPTASSSQELPLAERFFAGGSGTFRGTEPDFLGPVASIPLLLQASGGKYAPQISNGNLINQIIPFGGQGLALINLDYRFPLYHETIWGEVFLDVGQVYQSLKAEPASERLTGAPPPFPPLRSAAGVGLIFKLGFPIKVEYGTDVKRILGRPRSRADQESQLHSLLISAGFQF